ncbi:unnamed protein product [Lactuca virosa]|uniref:Uncharacterized protein n=1 Tax=Lactuca virosa TaxID=75947 RepID=A0AAU9PN80_9ASTR|nr:unnamed protein product [Lactuca virosa]
MAYETTLKGCRLNVTGYKKKRLENMKAAMDFRDWCKNECVRLLGSKGLLANGAHDSPLFLSSRLVYISFQGQRHYPQRLLGPPPSLV